jgi:hypothetical protein
LMREGVGLFEKYFSFLINSFYWNLIERERMGVEWLVLVKRVKYWQIWRYIYEVRLRLTNLEVDLHDKDIKYGFLANLEVNLRCKR